MLGLGLWSLYARVRGGLFESPWLYRAAIAMGPSGFLAVLAGWITTEVGRQPYTVQGLMTTVESASPVAAAAIASSLVGFILVYFTLFGAGLFYLLRLMSMAPMANEADLSPDAPIHAAGIMPAPVLTKSGTFR